VLDRSSRVIEARISVERNRLFGYTFAENVSLDLVGKVRRQADLPSPALPC
jgi:hypothetical protein